MAISTITGERVSDNPIARLFTGIGDLARGGKSKNQLAAEPKLGDDVPDAPQLATDTTGISSSGTQEALQAERLELRGIVNKTPEQLERARFVNSRLNAGDPKATVEELGQGVVTSAEELAEGEQAAQEEDQARAGEFAGKVQGDIDETTGRIDEASDRLQESEQRLQENLEGAAEQIEAIPAEVTKEFDRLRDEFGDQADVSFDRIDSQRTEALGKADQGRSAAMQAAVQGIQGNVNNQVAQIMSNPNLTDAQKQGMVSQVRLAGASSMAPAIGATVLQFNQLSADISTKFGAITGQLEGIVLQSSGQLAGLQGNAFAEAQIQVGKMTNQLLEIDANASAGFANAQSQLLATRSHATMTGNDILLRTLPEQSTPYLDMTGAAVLSYEIGRDLLITQFEMNLQSQGMDLQIEMLRSMEGNPVGNMWEGFLSGVSQFGLKGGLIGAAAAVIGGGGPRI